MLLLVKSTMARSFGPMVMCRIIFLTFLLLSATCQKVRIRLLGLDPNMDYDTAPDRGSLQGLYWPRKTSQCALGDRSSLVQGNLLALDSILVRRIRK